MRAHVKVIAEMANVFSCLMRCTRHAQSNACASYFYKLANKNPLTRAERILHAHGISYNFSRGRQALVKKLCGLYARTAPGSLKGKRRERSRNVFSRSL